MDPNSICESFVGKVSCLYQRYRVGTLSNTILHIIYSTFDSGKFAGIEPPVRKMGTYEVLVSTSKLKLDPNAIGSLVSIMPGSMNRPLIARRYDIGDCYKSMVAYGVSVSCRTM